MKSQNTTTPLLDAAVRVPDHVVYRDFPNETVVLNVQSGTYHGLNPTAGRMLEHLSRSPSVALAASEMAASFGLEEELVATDMCELCEALAARGLIEVQGSGGL